VVIAAEGTFTVSVALPLVVLPAEFVATTLNTAPLSEAAVEAMEYVAAVAPAMFVPLRRHWYVIVWALEATTVKFAGCPAVTVTDAGCVVIDGAVAAGGGAGGFGAGAGVPESPPPPPQAVSRQAPDRTKHAARARSGWDIV
jgi:hypothetical protein